MFAPHVSRGGYVVFRDAAGLRHAVRFQAILGIHELDPGDGGGVLLSMSGGRVAAVDADFEACLAELAGLSGWRR